MALDPVVDVFEVGGVPVAAVDMAGLLDSVDRCLACGPKAPGAFVTFCGAHGIVESQTRPGVRQAYHDAWLTVADGRPIFWIGRLLGFSATGHVPGIKSVEALCRRGVAAGWSHDFLGGGEGVAERLAAEMGRRVPGLAVAGWETPPFRSFGAEEVEAMRARIRLSGARVLWVGLGAPKQELFLAEHAPHLPGIVGMGGGGAPPSTSTQAGCAGRRARCRSRVSNGPTGSRWSPGASGRAIPRWCRASSASRRGHCCRGFPLPQRTARRPTGRPEPPSRTSRRIARRRPGSTISDTGTPMSQQMQLPRPTRASAQVAGGLRGDAVQLWLAAALAVSAAAGVAAVVVQQWRRPLWADEVTTMKIVEAGSWSHMFAGIRAGLDSTPPLYTAFGWALVHLGVSPDQVQSGLRCLDSLLLVLFLGLAYRIGRVFLDRFAALIALALFMLALKGVLVALALDLRTYMVYLFFAATSLCTGVGLLRRPSSAMGAANAASLALLTFSHTVGIVYTLCLSGALVLVHALHGDLRAARAQVVRTVPAVLIIALWLPVVRAQAQLGSYIDKPSLKEFLKAFYVYPGSAVGIGSAALLAFAFSPEARQTGTRSAARTLLSRGRSLLSSPDKGYCLLAVSSFFAATCAVWLFSHGIFPVFMARYFEPNVILAFVVITMLVWCAGVLYGAGSRVALIAVGVVASALTALLWTPEAERKIPCYDGAQGAFFEDADRGDLPVLTLYSQAWLSRVGRRNEVALYPSDTTMASDDPDDAAHGFEVSYMRHFADWSHDADLKSTDELAGLASGFAVLDDGKGGWLKRAQADPRFRFRLVVSKALLGRTCKLWKVNADR